MRRILLIMLVVFSSNVLASTPACYSSHGGYCQYTGKVSKIYINSGNLILIYFETAMPVENALEAGITITNGHAGAYRVSDNPDFAKLFYSTALAAQASKRNVILQLRGSESGYLRFDRIWLNE